MVTGTCMVKETLQVVGNEYRNQSEVLTKKEQQGRIHINF